MEQLTPNEFEIAAVDEAEANTEIERLPALTARREAAQANMHAAYGVLKEAECEEHELDAARKALQANSSSEAVELHNLDLSNNREIVANFDAVKIGDLASQYRRRHDSYSQTTRALALVAEVLQPGVRVKKTAAKVDQLGWLVQVLNASVEESHILTLKLMLPAIKVQGKMLIPPGAATRALRDDVKQAEASLASARTTLLALERELEGIKASRGCNLPASLPR